MQYAQFNPLTYQMIGAARSLPSRWTTSSGATISNFANLSQAELYSFGWAPVTWVPLPDLDGYYTATTPSWDDEARQFVFAALPKDISALLKVCEAAIDQAASDACARYLSIGVAQDLRYAEKASEIKAYLAAENPDPADYPVMAAEAAACGATLAEKAAEISLVRNRWVELCAAIESARISGKRACAGCGGSATEILTARDAAIAQLEAI